MDRNSFALRILIALSSCLAIVSSQRERCFGGYCSGSYGDMKAICKDGYCYCTGQDYDNNTCLPDAYGCRIEVNSNTSLAKPRYNNQQRSTIYSCTPKSSSQQYEVHVLSVYEVINRRPPSAGNATASIVSSNKSGRPIILVLGSYEPVNWILNLPANITISKVILVAYYIAQSSVRGDMNQVQAVERKTWQWGMGFGSDTGGGDTVALLRQVHNLFGVVTSFTGTYKADQWSLTLSSSQALGSAPLPSVIPTAILGPTRRRCHSNFCPGSYKMKSVCKDGYCVCTGQDYDNHTCLPDANGCKIRVNTDKALAKPWYNNQLSRTVYSCTPENSSSEYEVHVLSVYEVVNSIPPSAGDATVNIVGRGSSNRPIILVLGSYEPVHWTLKLPADLIISIVIMIAPYGNQASISGDLGRVKKVGHNWHWDMGYGSDFDGGDTAAFLKQVYNRFGVVTSFTGTYRADEWFLELSSPQGPSGPNCLSQETDQKCSGVSKHKTLEKSLGFLVILIMIANTQNMW